MRSIKILSLLFFLFAGTFIYAQRGRGPGNSARPHPHAHQRHHGPRAARIHSPYRPAKLIVYHPYWRPAYSYHRRWVYFPRYNMYWDNWRNHYVFYTGTAWVSQPALPVGVDSSEVAKADNKELKDSEDDVDDVYKSNEEHKKETKTE